MWKLIITFLIFCAHCCGFAVASKLLQASWLPVSYHTTTIEDINASIQSLAQHGVNRIYVDVWNQGVVYFQSPTMERFMGNKSNAAVGRDILGWVLQAAPQYDIEVVAWFEYGLMSAYALVETNAFAAEAQSRGWILGEHNNYYWMNASMVEVQDWFVSLLEDALDHYTPLGLRGVQLDDHFGYPVSLGGNVTVMNQFMNKIHLMVQNVNSKEGGTKPLLSLAPSIQSMSLDTYSVDWDLWGQQKLYDEVIPQLYRSSIDAYISVFQETVTNLSVSTKALFVGSGIRVDGSGSSTAEADVRQMIQYTKDHSVGNAIWYCRGILETYPAIFPMEW